MMTKTILHLGGNWNRIQQTTKLALQYPKARVIISGEGNLDKLYQYVKAKGVDVGRLINEPTAKDTLGNFTESFDILKDLQTRDVFVVTNDWHMKRAMAIAKVVYSFTGIKPIASPFVAGSRVDLGSIQYDVSRALKWKLSRLF